MVCMRRAALLLALLAPAAVAQIQTACSPGITFGSLLGSVRVGYGDGRLQVDRLYAVCLPEPARKSKTNFGYEPDDGGLLQMRVRNAGGQVLNTYVWYAERISGLWELSRYKVVGGFESVKPLAAGSYTLEFAADERPFARFAFSVASMKSDDPYQPTGERYFIDGPWSQYGNLYYQRNDPQSSLVFTAWVQDRAGKEGKRSVPYELKLLSARGVAIAEEAGTLRLEPRWLSAQLFFRPPGDRNSYTKAAQVLSGDGAYRIRLTVDGKLYGEYPFTVKGGRIQFQGRQLREGTDPMEAITESISGGKYSTWWLQKDAR